MGQSEAAIAECEAALALRPDETGAILTRGNALEKLAAAQRSQNGWLALLAVLLTGVIVVLLWQSV